MNTILKAGLVLGILCNAWTYALGFTGLYKNPDMSNLFFVVILIHIAVLIWGLQQTAAQGRMYGGQVLSGTMISGVGAVLIFLGSILFTAVVFPDYFQEVMAMQEQKLMDKGMSAEEIERVTTAMAPFMTPVVNAITGAVMTVIFGCLFSLIIAIFVRAKSQPTAPQSSIA